MLPRHSGHWRVGVNGTLEIHVIAFLDVGPVEGGTEATPGRGEVCLER
ncbi:hypothetical protein E2C01_087410 [Portunus trituberculatus]|uniref:Uncharacterized protein n=1 Tax=Portunus trituberculatus TaxID=210409 RepID=A0A5B7JG41_PORTR|nr:hypothetical protein [Portunus trituberculatus]